jgi:AcrR family transcriptional regulator
LVSRPWHALRQPDHGNRLGVETRRIRGVLDKRIHADESRFAGNSIPDILANHIADHACQLQYFQCKYYGMTKRPSRATSPYHHGDLKSAVLEAAEKILERDGLQELTLRAVARAVGVSHTAPKNHFGDLMGLLSELAAVGYLRYGAALAEAVDLASGDARDRMRAMGWAYVAFARAHPRLFSLMFHGERLDIKRPSLSAAIEGSRQALRAAIISTAPAKSLKPIEVAARATASWALVHGFAMLLLDGRLKNTMASLPGVDVDTFLEAVLDVTRVGD